jgi:lipopolysaccharide transport system permease protein
VSGVSEQQVQLPRLPQREAAPERQIVIQPVSGWSALRLHELWEYRDLLMFMTWRDLQSRYRQMAIGPLWIVLQPILNMVLYTLIFGNIARLPSDGKPYALFAFTALLPWGIFADAVGAASGSLVANRHLMNKVYFPRLLFTVSRVMISLIDFAIAFVILIILLVAYGERPNWGALWTLPLLLVMAVLAGTGVGLWFSGVMVRFRDFGQLLGLLLRFWMYATPVVYSIELIEERFREPWISLYHLNPMTTVVEGFRWALLGTEWTPNLMTWLSIAIFSVVLVAGLYIFRRVERTIVDIA